MYRQKTLIVTSPDDNREQEQFLGYTWSNRKGQEGIKIKSLGGKLYNPSNRLDSNSIAGLVRVSFDNKELHVPELEKYYYYLNTKDMLDFSSATFNKAIKTNKIRQLKQGDNLTLYKLSDKNIFDLQIGNRVLSSEIMSDGKIPVYSANVFEPFGYIDKQNIAGFSTPSVLWGIDGDWMVNLMPISKPFYPTDHCGVLRIKTDKILPEYMVYALKSAGEQEHFSRSNRASTARIKSLSVQIPSVEVQQKIVDEINEINSSIKNAEATLKMYDEKIKSKFVEMFGDISDVIQIGECCFIEKGATLTREEAVQGDVPVVAGGMVPSCYHNKANRPANVITVSASGANAGFVAFWNTPIFATDCNTILSKDITKFLIEYIYYSLLSKQKNLYALQRGAGQPHVYKKDIEKITIPNCSILLQTEFANYARSIDKLKFEVNNKKKSLQTRKEVLLTQYFE